MRLPVCCSCLLLLLVAGIRGQDDAGFDLMDALDDVTTKPKPDEGVKPTTKPKPEEGVIPKEPTPEPKPEVPDATPKKPTVKPQPGAPLDDFNLGDAVEKDGQPKQPTAKPKPAQPAQPGGGGGVFDDSDLGGGHHDNNPGGHDNKPSGGQEQGQGGGGENQSMVAGIVSTVAVAVVGAVSSFIAYQKKKLCFKGATEDPENVNMESHKGDQSEPQVQSTLLAK
ncbi:CD99 antigen [Leptodactylus fuscus]|uniref:CD99 antigen n=1 Tax=Leptodactylus fuscus TaxID=238119 RepID=UPI003F4EDC9C